MKPKRPPALQDCFKAGHPAAGQNQKMFEKGLTTAPAWPIVLEEIGEQVFPPALLKICTTCC
jgi:hypothetical protein